jgi:hypothetical protein
MSGVLPEHHHADGAHTLVTLDNVTMSLEAVY